MAVQNIVSCMEREVLLTGIGGQGVQLAAQVLARAATAEGRHVMSLGTYGGSMRGGDTDASLLLGDAPISAPPIVSRAWAVVGMHPRNWDAALAKLRDGGVALVNGDLFEGGAGDAVSLEATALATAAGSDRAAALVLVAALAGATGLVSLEALVDAMAASLPSYRTEHVETNARALAAGFEAAPKGLPVAFEAAA